ncbi:endonuclease/exonuclease/phosphatase family protein [Glycomyces sp. YM15]|uniref:endonuclease/exonuclease/phosphatase family protein n=1 Tax=Glycomyces sp. YM15 TaxID=2800446 RepID=UPI001964DCE1|nr:endonuclease/exonuclease/phosphatase family protein [Glycomyces sp. YM15]
MVKAPTVRFVLQNIAHGGFRLTGGGQVEDDRWPEGILPRLQSAGPIDVLALNECRGWETETTAPDGTVYRPYLERAQKDLGLELAGITRVHTLEGQPSVILYNPDTMGDLVNFDDRHRDQFYHGYGIATWNTPGLEQPLSLAVCHLDPYDRERSKIEAAKLATHAYYNGPYAFLAGDFNSSPITGPDPDIEKMRPYNRANRCDWTLDAATGERIWTPNREVAQRLLDYEYYDTAVLHHERTGDMAALARTGKTDRIDWVMASRALRDTVVDYRMLTEPAGASDHMGLAVTLDLAKCAPATWAYA